MFSKTTTTEVHPLLANTKQVARLLNVSERTVFSLHANGELPALKIGGSLRFSIKDLHEMIQRRLEENQKKTED